ncbi:MAG: tetratricopeptide repeat protein [Xenococcus sp. (in: cyanobacteria)]
MPALNEAMESAEQVGTTLSSLVPQLFFDLIARIIPGLVIIWSLYLALLGNKLLNSKDLVDSISSLLPENEFFVFCIAIVVFYTASILFFGLWVLCIFPLKEIYNKCKLPKKNRCEGNRCKKNRCEDLIEVIEFSENFSSRYYYIKLNAPIAGSRITKLHAEMDMSGSLTATYLLCFLFSIIFWCHGELEQSEKIAKLLFFFLGSIGFFYSNLCFTARLSRSVNSYSKLLLFKKIQDLNNLAASEQAKGNLVVAEQAYRQALEIKTQILGKSHPELAITLNNLASVLKERGKIAEAKSFSEKAIAILNH